MTIAEYKKVFSWKPYGEGSIMITSYKGNETEVVIPSIIGKKSVKSIGDNAFMDCCSLRNIVLPKSLKTIGRKAFWGCVWLQDKDGFVVVNNTVFDYLGIKGSITIPNNVTAISERAFASFDCQVKISDINLPIGLKTIGKFAFANSKIATLKIPDSVTKIQFGAFLNCRSLT